MLSRRSFFVKKKLQIFLNRYLWGKMSYIGTYHEKMLCFAE
jgi:hypothetical protein